MRNIKIPFALLSLLLIASLAFGQARESKDLLARIKKSGPATSQKTSSHDDMPLYCLGYSWNNLAWDTSGQSTMAYYPNGNLQEEQNDGYNSGLFYPGNKNLYTYDASNRITQEIGQSWNGLIWENNDKETYSYDAQGNMLVNFSCSWNSGVWDTVNGIRNTYSYNGSQVVSETAETWDTNNLIWVYDSKIDYSYTTANEWDTVIFSGWDGSGWVPGFRIIDIVWNNFSKMQATSGKFQAFVTLWVDAQRFTCAFSQYDSEDCVYEKYTGTWNNESRDIRNNDVNGHSVLSEEFSWNGSWQRTYGWRSTYNYDGQGRTLDVTYEGLDTLGAYENNFRKVFSTFFVGADVFVNPALAAKVFPNPATDRINFDLQLQKNGAVAIVLYDLQGRRRLETAVNYHGQLITVPVSSGLENGTYIYRVSNGRDLAGGKVLIQR